MQLKDLIPSTEQLKKIQDVESALVRRRTVGTFAGVIAIVSAVLQIVLVLEDKPYLDTVISMLSSIVRLQFGELASLSIDTNKLIGWIALFLALSTYFVLRRTGVFVKESKEPFRYTFWIKKFDQIDKTPDKRFDLQNADRLQILDHDLKERLNERIRRFSVLKDAPDITDDNQQKISDARQGSSHIHISGNWVVREDGEGNWLLQVTPSTRIGPEGSPATLATPVRFPLDRADGQILEAAAADKSAKDADGADRAEDSVKKRTLAGYRLNAKEYMQIVERVYSRIATDVYDQIDSDVRQKIKLFPTARLRALALYFEAEDFASSNTVDAYQRAIELYRDAMRFFEKGVVSRITHAILRFPWWLWRIDIKFHHQWALMVAGYAKCLTYQREMSALAGRDRNPLFELPELIGSAIVNMEILHRKMGRAKSVDRIDFLQAAIHFPKDSWTRLLTGRVRNELFEAQKKHLVDLYLVDGFAHYFLENTRHTKERLRDACAVSPDHVAREPLFALMLGLIEPVAEKRIVHHRQAVDLAPNFQMARWYLAKAYETEFKRRDEITKERAQLILDHYEDLLKINYGNITALASQGYMLWLIRDESAKSKFEEGREIKVVARETFVGELDYRLARIAAEAGDYDECFLRYIEAKEADPAVGSYYPGEDSRIDMTDYENIGADMLRRFREYSRAVEVSITALRAAPDDEHRYSDVTLNTVLCFVLNDYGNACLKYFHFHGDIGQLSEAIKAYEKAIAANPKDAVPWFNVQNAYGWTGQRGKVADCYAQAQKLAPTWLSVAIAAAQENVRTISQELSRSRADASKNWEAAVELRRALVKSQTELADIKSNQVNDLLRSARQIVTVKEVRLYTVDSGSVEKIVKQDRNKAEPIRSISTDLIAALRQVADDAPQDEVSLFDRLEDLTGQSLTDMQRFVIRTQALKPLSSADVRERRSKELAEQAVRLHSRELELNRRISRDEKELEKLDQKRSEMVEKQQSLEKQFAESHKSALEVITTSSRLEPLFQGRLEERIARLVAIPWRKLDGRDVETLTSRAEVLALATDDPEFLRASMRLAERLFLLMPEKYRIVTVLMDVIPKLIKHEKNQPGGPDSPGVKDLQARHERVNAAWLKIVRRWMELHSDQFLALYWFLSVGDFADEKSLAKVREENFRGEPCQFENLLGHVYYTIGRSDDAIKAYSRAVEIDSSIARHHYYLGRAYDRIQDWNAARSSFSDAYRLDQGEPEYAYRLAAAYNRIGNRFYSSGAYEDAEDNYRQAIELSPEEGVYFSNLSLALEGIAEESRGASFADAISAKRLARKYDPEDTVLGGELARLERKQSAFDAYGTASSMDLLTVVTPIAVEYAENLGSLIRGENGSAVSEETRERVAAMQTRLQDRYGVKVPGVRWRANQYDLPDGTYIFMLSEVPIVSGNLSTDHKFSMTSVDDLEEAGIKAEEAIDPLTGGDAAWVGDDQWPAAEENKVELLDPVQYLLRHLESLVARNLVEFLGHQEVDDLLQSSGDGDISGLREDLKLVDQLSDVLRALVAERVPITAFNDIVRKFEDIRNEMRAEELIEEIRNLPQIQPSLPGNSKAHTLISPSDKFESTIGDAITDGDGIRVLALEPEVCQDLLTSIRNETQDVLRPVLVTKEASRRIHLRKLVELEFPDMPVLSQRELLEGLETAASPVIRMPDE